MTLLDVRELRAGFGNREVLHGVDAYVEQGEIVALIGPNGAGKSTLLASLMGMASARGKLAFQGRSLLGMRTEEIARLGIALVPQGRRLFPTMTVRQNLQLGAYSRDRGRAASCDIERCLRYFPALCGRQEQRADSLSGGEQQMLAIARGLMLRPALLLLDEPSLGLAPRVTADVFRALSEINASEGSAVLVVEQNVRLVLSMARRAYLLDAGEMVLEGAAATVAADEGVRRAYLGY